jgi:hypothetical protein
LRVPSISPTLVAAGLAWVAVLWVTPRYLRERRDIRLRVYWQTVALLAISITFAAPEVYGPVDRLLAMPNAARWISNALGLVALYMIDTFYFAMKYGTERLRWHRPWLIACLALAIAAMAFFLWRAQLPADTGTLDFPQVRPAVVAYRMVYLTVFAFFIVRLIANAAHYRRHVPHALVKLGMALTMLAGIWGLGYVGFTLVVALTSTASPLAASARNAAETCLVASVFLVVLSVTVPSWARRLGVAGLARHARALVAYRRLHPLWRRLARAQPKVVLPTAATWWSAVWRPREMELLLRRHVFEILDARRLLLTGDASAAGRERPFVAAGVLQTGAGPEGASFLGQASVWPMGARGRPRLPSVDEDLPGDSGWLGTPVPEVLLAQRAREEAEFLDLRLRGVMRDATTMQPTLDLHQPSTYGESVRYLELVAAALRPSIRRRRIARRPRAARRPEGSLADG